MFNNQIIVKVNRKVILLILPLHHHQIKKSIKKKIQILLVQTDQAALKVQVVQKNVQFLQVVPIVVEKEKDQETQEVILQAHLIRNINIRIVKKIRRSIIKKKKKIHRIIKVQKKEINKKKTTSYF